MTHIPMEQIQYLEFAIYLPMLIVVLDKDHEQIEKGEFKLKRPYVHLIEEARKIVMEDLKKTKAYMKKCKLKVIQGQRDELFTEYQFHYNQLVDKRRYSNIRLRNQVELLLNQYLTKASINFYNGKSSL